MGILFLKDVHSAFAVCFSGLVHSVFLPALLLVLLFEESCEAWFYTAFLQKGFERLLCVSVVISLICPSTFLAETGFTLCTTQVLLIWTVDLCEGQL